MKDASSTAPLLWSRAAQRSAMRWRSSACSRRSTQGTQSIDLADPDAGADTPVLGEAGARELIVLLGMLVGHEDGRDARKQQLVEGIVAYGADHEVERPQVSARGYSLSMPTPLGSSTGRSAMGHSATRTSAS